MDTGILPLGIHSSMLNCQLPGSFWRYRVESRCGAQGKHMLYVCVWSWGAQGEGKPDGSGTGSGGQENEREHLRLASVCCCCYCCLFFKLRSAHRDLREWKVGGNIFKEFGGGGLGGGRFLNIPIKKSQTCSGNIISYKPEFEGLFFLFFLNIF